MTPHTHTSRDENPTSLYDQGLGSIVFGLELPAPHADLSQTRVGRVQVAAHPDTVALQRDFWRLRQVPGPETASSFPGVSLCLGTVLWLSPGPWFRSPRCLCCWWSGGRPQ